MRITSVDPTCGTSWHNSHVCKATPCSLSVCCVTWMNCVGAKGKDPPWLWEPWHTRCTETKISPYVMRHRCRLLMSSANITTGTTRYNKGRERGTLVSVEMLELPLVPWWRQRAVAVAAWHVSQKFNSEITREKFCFVDFTYSTYMKKILIDCLTDVYIRLTIWTDKCSAVQVIWGFLLNSDVHRRVHKSLVPVPILMQLIQEHILTFIKLKSILILYSSSL